MASSPPLSLPDMPRVQPTWATFQVWWQEVRQAIEANAASNQYVLDQLDENLSGSTGVMVRLAILGSYSIPTMVLSAGSSGALATVNIAPHVRHYDDGHEITLSGGEIANLAASTAYGIYYDDLARQLADPVYFATPFLQEAQHNYVPGRHYVGTVITPASGGPLANGGSPPAGSGYTAGAGANVIA